MHDALSARRGSRPVCLRSYVKRKAQDDFRAHRGESDPGRLSQLWSHAKAEFEAVQRQAIVYHLYARQHKSVMDVPLKQVLQAQSEAVDQIQGSLTSR